MSRAHDSLPPFRLHPYLKDVIWGGTAIAAFKGVPSTSAHLGESWELSAIEGKESVVADGPDRGLTLTQLIAKYGARLVGQPLSAAAPGRFPVLIKIIDACRDLSIQVHPDDDLAAELHPDGSGKTEMWYIVDARPGARIYAGFKRVISPDLYEAHVNSGEIMNDVAEHQSAPGMVFFLPPGYIHAIGEGNLLVEVQQSSDITYRVYDYDRRDASGRPRELHIENARRALNFEASPDGIVTATSDEGHGLLGLIDCPYFKVKRLSVDNGPMSLDLRTLPSFLSFTCIDGAISLHADDHPECSLRRGETAMVAASVNDLVVSGHGVAITVSVPAPEHSAR